MKSLLTPGIFLLVIAAVLQWGLTSASPAALASIFYGVCAAGAVLAWRFHSSRIFTALVLLFLAQRAVSYFSSPGSATSGHAALVATALLLPANFVLLSFQEEKGFNLPSLAPWALLIFVESVIVTVLGQSAPAAQVHAHQIRAAGLPFAAELVFSAAAILLLIRFLLFHKPAENGLLWALAASFLALRLGGAGRIPTGYFAAAAFILAGAVVETSYLLAYHDELTTLPSRRAFNSALLRLECPYTIAMVDIDHFKRCNDTYGHDTGDEVLRLVASRLAKVSGGGEAYRCGGEEFAIVFPGKTTAEVIEPLEKLRATVETSQLRLRGPDRRQQPRGPDRRNQRPRKAGHAIRQLTHAAAPREISVTVSIGVATGTAAAEVEQVIKAADKALYAAKNGGRNRVELATNSKARPRARAAGIA
ncbi:MAG TPA: GGDEF domain-containing protein [Candidatus Binatia bacterium]|nr:GGDEF domain-containing protein [Candidatus Binatia bacterium]